MNTQLTEKVQQRKTMLGTAEFMAPGGAALVSYIIIIIIIIKYNKYNK